jgi:conjugal transfer/entry exclusion protein
MSNKVQLERNNIKNMVEETAKENEKIWTQLDGILVKINNFGEDSKLFQSNPAYSKDDKFRI